MRSMLKDMLRVALSSASGKIGFSLLIFLIGSAIFVAVTYPSNFGNKVWNNPAYWADNPKAAPPTWSDSGKTKHQVLTRNEAEVQKSSHEKTFVYRFKATLAKNNDPDFLSFSLSDVHFWGDSPVITVTLEQKEQKAFLYQYVVPGRDIDEPSPAVRFHDEPLRVQLTADALAKDASATFFNSLRQSGEDNFSGVVNVRFSDARDTAGTAKFVVGGQTYGLLGTDTIGRDIQKGLTFGLPYALLVGFIVAFLSTVIGAVIGGISGYAGGFVDTIIQRIIDVKSTIPALPILIFLVFTVGPSLWNVIIFMVVFGWMGLAIQLRPWIMQIRENGFIALARARGFSATCIIFRHLLPQTLPLLFANFVLTVPAAIMTEAGLSFLGLGDPSIPTWGYLLEQGYQTGAVYLGYWWWVIPPGAAIVFTSFTYFLLSMALEPYVEPRLRR